VRNGTRARLTVGRWPRFGASVCGLGEPRGIAFAGLKVPLVRDGWPRKELSRDPAQLSHSFTTTVFRLSVVAVVTMLTGCERHAPKHFARLCRANDHEMPDAIVPVVDSVAYGQLRGGENVGDLYQLVRVGALISVGTQG
jgi:hypothetical protein